jgi:hypothetical protein
LNTLVGLSEDPVVAAEQMEDVIVIMEVVAAELDDQFGWTSKFTILLW